MVRVEKGELIVCYVGQESLSVIVQFISPSCTHHLTVDPPDSSHAGTSDKEVIPTGYALDRLVR